MNKIQTRKSVRNKIGRKKMTVPQLEQHLLVEDCSFMDLRHGSIQFDVGNGRIVLITATWLSPKEAALLLEINTRNRKIKRADVDKLKFALENGLWEFTGKTVKIASDENGQWLADAQHTLTAISEGTRKVPVLIVENISAEATKLIDQERNRNVSDILKMSFNKTVENENSVASIAKLVMAGSGLAEYSSRDRTAVAEFCNINSQILEEWARWAHLQSVMAQRVVHNRSLVSSMPCSSLGALAIYMVENGGNAEMVRDFFERISSGVVSESDKSNVIAAIRKRQTNGYSLSRQVMGGGSSLSSLFSEFAVYINAYNKWVRNERVEIIKSIKHPVKDFSELPKCISLG